MYKTLAQGIDAVSVRAWLQSGNKQHHTGFCPHSLAAVEIVFLSVLLHLNYPRSVCHAMGCAHTSPPPLNSLGILWSLEKVGKNLLQTWETPAANTGLLFLPLLLNLCLQAGQESRIFSSPLLCSPPPSV